jgi:hypothetical protein
MSVVEAMREGQCPICGRCGFRVPLLHIAQAHDISEREFRLSNGLPYGISLVPPEVSALYADNARTRANNNKRLESGWTARTRAKSGAALSERLHIQGLSDRDTALIADATSGNFLRYELAVKYNITSEQTRRILDDHGIEVPFRKIRAARPEERERWRARRVAAARRAKQQSDESKAALLVTWNTTDQTFATLKVMAKEAGMSPKTFREKLKRVGAAVPDGRRSR